jgi:hypothetical protein
VPWEMFRSAIPGWGHWSFYSPNKEGSSTVTSTWIPFDGDGPGPDSATIYLGEAWDADAPADLVDGQTVIPSRRLASLRRGIADYRSLELLKTLVALRGADPAYASEVAAAQETLDVDVPATVDTPGDRGLAEQTLAAVQEHIEALTTQCNDGVDNDGDGAIDSADPNCASSLDDQELAGGGCGLGFEVAPVLLALGSLRRRARARARRAAQAS